MCFKHAAHVRLKNIFFFFKQPSCRTYSSSFWRQNVTTVLEYVKRLSLNYKSTLHGDSFIKICLILREVQTFFHTHTHTYTCRIRTFQRYTSIDTRLKKRLLINRFQIALEKSISLPTLLFRLSISNDHKSFGFKLN